MKRSGWDARRRNRNIGTSKSGHGQDNRLTIPQAWADERRFYEKLNNPVSLDLRLGENTLGLLIEETHPDFFHACTPADIERVIKLIPRDHLAPISEWDEPIRLIVLRQPKKKEQILSNVWGRFQYWADIGQYSGPAVHLDAQPKNGTIKWRKSLIPDGQTALDRLERDGHEIKTDRRYYYITGNPRSIRNTQLFGTLPHEIGHYVDYLKSVKIPSGDDFDKREQLGSIFDSKPSKEKEDFANRYATEFLQEHARRGELPFERIYDPETLRESGLDPAWFNHD